jgi:hypothetical protein
VASRQSLGLVELPREDGLGRPCRQISRLRPAVKARIVAGVPGNRRGGLRGRFCGLDQGPGGTGESVNGALDSLGSATRLGDDRARGQMRWVGLGDDVMSWWWWVPPPAPPSVPMVQHRRGRGRQRLLDELAVTPTGQHA